jgi:hypothetical protein
MELSIEVKSYQYGHHFAIGQMIRLIPAPFTRIIDQKVFFESHIKFL